MMQYCGPELSIADDAAKRGDFTAARGALRALPLADFCEAVWHRAPGYSALRKILPGMPTPEQQARWTGHSGSALLLKSAAVVRQIEMASWQTRGRAIRGPVLDYGCGWGRLTRMFLRFAEPDQIVGADPMEDSLTLCRNHNLPARLVPLQPGSDTFPLRDLNADFALCYSVLTHTSRETTEAILKSVRCAVANDGLFCATIRPVEFWKMRAGRIGADRAAELIQAHDSTGYAFATHGKGGRELKEDAYGDSSYRIDLFADLAAKCGWRFAGVDRDAHEPYQLLVKLVPAN